MGNTEVNKTTDNKPIACPNCRSHEIVFVTEYHKCIAARINFVISLIVAIYLSFMNFNNSIKGKSSDAGIVMLTIFFLLLSVGMYIGITIAESKTHIQAICKDCGHLWLLN